jgi:hypothetical protein
MKSKDRRGKNQDFLQQMQNQRRSEKESVTARKIHAVVYTTW